jgi:hypothetical protein
MPASATGISWYHRGDYEALLGIFVDGASLPQSYDDWLAQATDLERQVRRSGGRVIRAYVDPVEFPKWCLLTGNQVDASGRVAYGSAFAAETLSKERASSNKKTKTWKTPT